MSGPPAKKSESLMAMKLKKAFRSRKNRLADQEKLPKAKSVKSSNEWNTEWDVTTDEDELKEPHRGSKTVETQPTPAAKDKRKIFRKRLAKTRRKPSLKKAPPPPRPPPPARRPTVINAPKGYKHRYIPKPTVKHDERSAAVEHGSKTKVKPIQHSKPAEHQTSGNRRESGAHTPGNRRHSGPPQFPVSSRKTAPHFSSIRRKSAPHSPESRRKSVQPSPVKRRESAPPKPLRKSLTHGSRRKSAPPKPPRKSLIHKPATTHTPKAEHQSERRTSSPINPHSFVIREEPLSRSKPCKTGHSTKKPPKKKRKGIIGWVTSWFH